MCDREVAVYLQLAPPRRNHEADVFTLTTGAHPIASCLSLQRLFFGQGADVIHDPPRLLLLCPLDLFPASYAWRLWSHDYRCVIFDAFGRIRTDPLLAPLLPARSGLPVDDRWEKQILNGKGEALDPGAYLDGMLSDWGSGKGTETFER